MMMMIDSDNFHSNNSRSVKSTHIIRISRHRDKYGRNRLCN